MDERVITVETPFPEYAVPRVWTWIQEFRWRVSDDYGPKSLQEFMESWRMRAPAEHRWAVYRDGDLGGVVTCQQVSPVLTMSHCLFKKSFWGQATTIPALSQVFTQIFSAGIERIEAIVFRDNSEIIGLTRKLGFRTEGMLRARTRRNDKLVDMVMIGLLKEDFENALVNSNNGGWQCAGGRVEQPSQNNEVERRVDDHPDLHPRTVGDRIEPPAIIQHAAQ